jgi:hypothetical protein
MAAGRLPRPGTELGPCEGGCNHSDCQGTWEMAKRHCKYCSQPIGFDRDFFDLGNFEWAHASCAFREADRISKAGGRAE